MATHAKKPKMTEEDEEPSAGVYGNKTVQRMMGLMGHEKGRGLGKNKQGMVEPISAQMQNKVDRRAVGADEQEKLLDEEYKDYPEIKTVEETPTWLKCDQETRNGVESQICDKWIVTGKPKWTLDDECRYCDAELIDKLLKSKSVFDTVKFDVLNAARARANPYETIKAGFFQNRAAMKMANLDKIYKWRLSREFDVDKNRNPLEEEKRHATNPLEEGKPRRNEYHRNLPLFYFADVCAGPGGFSEYMLWRKAFYNAKGFGFTLAGKDDFRLHQFKAASPEYFEPYYGVKEDGDVMDPENLKSLEAFIHQRIHGPEKGLHLVMCDGGFSVEGKENIQEILSKRLYLCQFIVGLSLCRVENGGRRGGNFLCKLFDVFTPFSMGLIYLMYLSFESISIHKPITSRPANSERYIFCENLNQFGANRIKDYMVGVNNRLNAMDKDRETVLELVPESVIHEDAKFFDYMRKSCEEIAQKQCFYLYKYKKYASNPGEADRDQEKLREEALRYWELPDFVERVPDQRRSGGQGPNSYRQQQREPVENMLLRYAGTSPFPINKRLAPFTANEPLVCPDVNELRAMLMMETQPVLLLSQGHDKLSSQARNDPRIISFGELNCTIPKETILFGQAAQLYEAKDGGKVEPICKCFYVLDAAVLNGDDVSRLDLKDRLNAARKFVEAVNRRNIRRTLFEQNDRKRGHEQRDSRDRRSYFAGHRNERFCELIVADVMRLNVLAQRQFEIKQIKGTKMAFFPVHAGDDLRDKAPQRHYLICRGVRVQNRLNLNFMLHYTKDAKTGQPLEGAVPRPNFHQSMDHCSPYANFYESLIGYVPREQWISTFPMGHPHNGAITFNWSWEPDYTAGLQVENILHDTEHKGGLTMPQLRRLVAQRMVKKEEPVGDDGQQNGE